MRNTPDDLLFQIKTRGPCRTLELANTLGISRQAALQGLEKLAAEGLVEHVTARAGVGRPRRSWSLRKRTPSREFVWSAPRNF